MQTLLNNNEYRALVFAVLGGSLAGLLGGWIFGSRTKELKISGHVEKPEIVIA